MTNPKIEELKNAVEDYQEKELSINLDGVMEMFLSMDKAKIYVTNERFIISGKNDIVIDLDHVDDFEVVNNIIKIIINGEILATID